MAMLDRAAPKKRRNAPRARRSSLSENDCCEELRTKTATAHPDHSGVLASLNRVRGQMAGIEGMIRDRRYCLDILTQFRAVASALRAVETSVLETHLRDCVRRAMKSKKSSEVENKIQEILDLTMRR